MVLYVPFQSFSFMLLKTPSRDGAISLFGGCFDDKRGPLTGSEHRFDGSEYLARSLFQTVIGRCIKIAIQVDEKKKHASVLKLSMTIFFATFDKALET